eukprot:gene13808-15879_t
MDEAPGRGRAKLRNPHFLSTSDNGGVFVWSLLNLGHMPVFRWEAWEV